MRTSYFTILFSLLTLVFCLISNADAWAQNKKRDPLEFVPTPFSLIQQQATYDRRYLRDVLVILEPEMYRDNAISIRSFVHAYSLSSMYDPYSEETVNTLYKHAFAFENAQNEEDKNKAAQEFKTTLEYHIANFDAVTAALSLARQYPALYDINKLTRIRALLIDRLLNSGTGGAASTAYVVYTAGEQEYLLMQKELKILQSDEIISDGYGFHTHLTKHKKTGEERIIFVNFSAAVKHHERQQLMEKSLYRHAISPSKEPHSLKEKEPNEIPQP